MLSTMQRGFTKLFNTIVTSTIWREDNETRILWITMLALSDRYGEVSASVPGLAAVANITEDGCRRGISKLESPDPDSRTPDNEGRRIAKADGGWRILNYELYRGLINAEERRQYQAKWAREKRRQKSTKSTNVDKNRHIAEAEAEAYSTDNPNGLSCVPTRPLAWSRTAGFKEITPDLHQKWRIAYPALNIDRQLAAMDQWLRANPAKAVKKNWLRFVTNWLERKQERGGDIPSFRSPKIFDPNTSERQNKRARDMADASASVEEIVERVQKERQK